MHSFANPARFLRLASHFLPWLMLGFILCFASGLYFALFHSPPDYLQGEMVRVMYVHVPAAIMAEAGYMFLAVASFASIIWKHPLADVAARCAAPIGAVFTLICLITGSLWGRPTWGTYWVWDARLTSVLVLFFLYLGYIALWSAIEDEARAAKAASILALFGVVNIPIIKFSVEWWHTLHQPASIKLVGKTTIDPAMQLPLLLMTLAYGFYFAVVLIWRMQASIAEQRLEARTRAQLREVTA